jgi:hypothetical protein
MHTPTMPITFEALACVCRAATETCDLLTGPNREECFASYGVDAERLDTYLGKALCLEAAYEGAHNTLQRTYVHMHTSVGEQHACLCSVRKG